jgi:hypothetical protein
VSHEDLNLLDPFVKDYLTTKADSGDIEGFKIGLEGGAPYTRNLSD